MKFYDEHPILHHYPRYPINVQSIQVVNDQSMPVKEAIKFLISFGGHTYEIIAYLLPFSTAFDFIFGLKTMTEIEGKSNFSILEFKFKKRSIDITPIKDIHLPVGPTTAIDCEMVKKPPDLSDRLVVVKMKSQREDCLPQTLRVAVMNGKIQMNVKNTGQGDLHLLRGQNIGIVDLRSAGYYHITRDGIQRCLHERFIFLNEKDSQDYLSLTHTISDITGEEPQKNTRLDVRKASTNRTVKTRCKDDVNKDPYPCLDDNDPRRNMSDKEILERTIDFSEVCTTEKQKQALYKILLKYREAFSLRDEIGLCPNMEVKLELKDKTPFYIRPFPIKEEEKIIVDREMRKGCLLGILRKGLSSYSSPIMLIPRKMSGIPCIITDFRHLNSRIVRLNCSFPLVRDAIQILGASVCELISVIDLRDAYHTLRLSTESQKYCGITPYYGSDTYLYQRLGMGLSVSPAIWQTFINKVLDEIPNRKHFLAIMDDCMIHSKRKDHLTHLVALLKALIRNGLKISPKKCQLFRQKLTYMGQTLLIKDNIPCITPLRSRVDAIQRLEPPKTPKECKKFCGLINYLSMYLKDLQKRLIPIYNLTRKGVPFEWTDEHQSIFEGLKKDIANPPVSCYAK